MRPTITICSDAAFSNDYKVGSWACYIRGPGLLIQTGARIKEPVRDSTEAERRGLANALHLLTKSVPDLSTAHLIIYCDNVNALVAPRGLDKKGDRGRKNQSMYDKYILNVALKAQSFETRHVKAHLKKHEWSNVSARNYMQDWCDRYARKLNRQWLKQLNKDKTDGVTA